MSNVLFTTLLIICQQAELDKAVDFLDPIDTDVPKGGKDQHSINISENAQANSLMKDHI